jgi:hypothetical protein
MVTDMKVLTVKEVAEAGVMAAISSLIVSVIVSSICAADVLVPEWNWNNNVFLYLWAALAVVVWAIFIVMTVVDNRKEIEADNE